jgi:N-dimethylarginine dimethylaminohydrolase
MSFEGSPEQRALHEAFPPKYHQVLFPPEPDPPFQDPDELRSTWGQAWGASDEVGVLRTVLVRSPGEEFGSIRADAWDPAVGALVDPGGRWYWTRREPPDRRRLEAQHAGLVAALEAAGAEVIVADPVSATHVKGMFTRDPLVTVPGGAIVSRMAPRTRRGEERDVTGILGGLGVPILGTIVGRGMFEGGTFAKLRPGLAVFGQSIRCNAEGADQVREILARIGWELLVVPIGGFSIHLDIHFAMVAPGVALVDAPGLPYWFLERLRAEGIDCVWRHPEEPWAVNCLVLRPGTVLMSESAPRTAALLERRGIEVVTIPYDEVECNGGGVHCSTMELRRDPA